MKRPFLWPAMLSLALAGAGARPTLAQNAGADFTIHSSVAAVAPPRAGFNLDIGDIGANVTTNAWTAAGGTAGADSRYVFTAEGGDTQSFYATDKVDAGGNQHSDGTDIYDTIRSGFYNGALSRTYRFANNQWTLLRSDTVAQFNAVGTSNSIPDHTVTFAATGPAIQAGDQVWVYQDNAPYVDWNYLSPRTRPSAQSQWFSAGSIKDAPPGDTDSSAGVVPYSIVTSCATTNNGNPWSTGNYIQGLYPNSATRFEAGTTYAVDVWVKQTGIADGKVTFNIGSVNNNAGVHNTFAVAPGVWKHLNWSFPAPTNLIDGNVGGTYQLAFNPPGTLEINNFRIYSTASAHDALDPRALASMKSFKPGTIRLWSGINGYHYWSLDSWLAPEGKARLWNSGSGTTTGANIHLPTGLALCKSVGADPWLICNIGLTEQEWSGLIDYLAAPASSTGYAALRPASHPGPYTADFNNIYLEFGNEQWGTNPSPFQPTYGQWAHHAFSAATANPNFNPGKLKFVLNGFTYGPGFGSGAIANAPEGSYVDFFSYSQGSGDGDAFYQNELLSVPNQYQGVIDGEVAQAAADAAAGHPHKNAVYEGGPGSDLPGQAFDVREHSLASAVAALDVQLYGSQRGFGPQNFFGFNAATTAAGWSSHTSYDQGFRPFPVWEALTMRNNDLAGDMVNVDSNQNAGSLIGTYVFHSGAANTAGTTDICVLSRDLTKTTPVTLHLPGTVNANATLYTLTGDPRANNDSALNVPIATQTITNFSTNYTFSMPPGSVYIFRTQTGTGTNAWPAAAPTGLSAKTIGAVKVSWNALSGATKYNLYRSTTPGGEGTTPYLSNLTTTSYTDMNVSMGTTYYYKLTGVSATGAETDQSVQAFATAGIADGSFEGVNISGGSYGEQQNPAGPDWNFAGASGVANSGSYFMHGSGTDLVADGQQAAYITGTASFSQNLTLPAGNYGLKFTVAQSGDLDASQNVGGLDFNVLLDGKLLSPTPILAQTVHYTTFQVPYFAVTAGTHTLTFQGVGSGGNGGSSRIAFLDSMVLFNQTPASPPVSLTAKAMGGIQLNWQPLAGATTYNLYRSTTSGGEGATSYVSGLTSTSYLDLNVAMGTGYFYTVTAVTSGYQTAQSLEATATAGIANGSFENPDLINAYGNVGTAPTGTEWTYSGGGQTNASGVARSNSYFMSGTGTDPAPDGVNAGYIQQTNSISQTVTLPAGYYLLNFSAAQVGSGQSWLATPSEDFKVLVDGAQIGASAFLPPDTHFTAYTTAGFTLAQGSHTITFQGVDSAGGQRMAFIDKVTLSNPINNLLFYTGFESSLGDPQPTWNDSVFYNQSVSGYYAGINPECSTRTGEAAFGGNTALLYSGTANAAYYSAAYCKVFSVNLPISSNTRLQYYIRPDNDNGRYVAIDLHCTDGTSLRDSGAVDSNGYSFHPNVGHGGNIPLGAWTRIEGNIGALAGKTVDQIWVAFDRVNGPTGQYRGYIDEIKIANSNTPLTSSHTSAAFRAANFRVANGAGVSGAYYSGSNFNTLVKKQTDAAINFAWGASAPQTSVGPTNYSVRWTGSIQAVESGDYTFTTQASGGVRLWINGHLLIDNWASQGLSSKSATIELAQNQKYALKMEFLKGTGGASARLLWKRPGQTNSVVVPTTQLYSTVAPLPLAVPFTPVRANEQVPPSPVKR